MVKGGKRGGRVRDKWRDKQWVVVKSPSAFGGGFLNYIPITVTNSAKGRVIENTMLNSKTGPHTTSDKSIRANR